MGRDDLVAEPLPQQMRNPFGHTARVDKHQRGATGAHLFGHVIEDVRHLLCRHHRLEI